MNYNHTHASVYDGSPAMVVSTTDTTITLVNEDGFEWTDPIDQWKPIGDYVGEPIGDYVGPVACVEIACENAGIELGPAQIGALAQELVDMGANFDA